MNSNELNQITDSQENTMIGIILTLLAVIALGILGEMVSGEF